MPAPVTNLNGYFTGTSPSFAGLSNKPVVSRRARVGTRPIAMPRAFDFSRGTRLVGCPEHSTLGHASIVGFPEHSTLGDAKSSSLALGVS